MKQAVWVASMVGLLSTAGMAAAQTLTRGPILQRVTTSSVVVVWDQDAASVPEVRYGATGYDHTAAAPASGTRHEIQLTGLEPGTEYQYAVFSGGSQLSADLSLRTAVPPGAPFRFIVYGDTRSDPVAHQRVVEAMALEPDIAFYVNTGDLVSSGEVPEQWDEFFRIEQPMASRVPLYPVIGNHDESDGQATLYVDLFSLPDSSPGGEHYYSFDIGNARFIVLDGHVHRESACMIGPWVIFDCFTEDQRSWLDQELTDAAMSPELDHTFVIVHVGPYTSKDGRHGSAQMRNLMGSFFDLGVTMILSGHDHYYERGESFNGIPYVISGGGGAPLYELSAPSPDPHTVFFNESTWHYVVVEVDGLAVRATAHAPDGRVLDEVEVDGARACEAVSECFPSGPPESCEGGTPRCTLGGRCAFDCPEPMPEPEPMPDPMPEPTGSEGGGCAVTARPEVGPATWGLLLLAGLLVAWRRR